VNEMNPCVHVETRVGGGTSVKVFLPRAGVAVGDHERESVDAEQRPPMKRKSSVLVVDDDKTVLKSIPQDARFSWICRSTSREWRGSASVDRNQT
jgi:hypothetical protein